MLSCVRVKLDAFILVTTLRCVLMTSFDIGKSLILKFQLQLEIVIQCD